MDGFSRPHRGAGLLFILAGLIPAPVDAAAVTNGDSPPAASNPPMYTLTMTDVPGGAVTPGSGVYAESTLVQITATPDPGYSFDGWTGTGAGSFTGYGRIISIRILGDITQTASFPPHPVLTMAAGPGGTVTPATGPFSPGSWVAINATPDSAFRFTGWVGSGSGSYTGLLAGFTVHMLGDITQTASFEAIPNYTLTMNPSPGGFGDPTGSYPESTWVPIYGYPDPGWVLESWMGTGLGSYTGPAIGGLFVQVLSDITETPIFAFPATHALAMLAGFGGTVTPPSGDYPNGSVIEITAVPDSGFVFDRWAGSGPGSYSGTANPASVTMDGSVYESAAFVRLIDVTVTTLTPGKRVSVDGVDHVSPYAFVSVQGAQHTLGLDALSLSASPDSQDVFVSWESGWTGTTRGVTVPNSAVTYTGTYKTQYLLHFQDPPDIVSSPGDGYYDSGTIVSVQAVATASHVFDEWVGHGPGSYSGPDNPASITVSGPIVQIPVSHQLGYEFSISASSVDPFVNTDAPTGPGRLLYLWMTCSEAGISAFDAGVTGTLAPLEFVPFNGILNAGTPIDLLLAVPGCPGAEAPFLLGGFVVNDSGGDLCLTPSSVSGLLGAVDCVSFGVTDPVQVTGFSSNGSAPCYAPGVSCSSADPVVGAEATTPEWAPLVDADLGAYPYPFRVDTELRLAVARTAPVRVSIYDVAGRLVKRVADEAMDPGEYAILWDGRNSQGKIVPSGVYFSQVQIGAFTASRKIVRVGGR